MAGVPKRDAMPFWETRAADKTVNCQRRFSRHNLHLRTEATIDSAFKVSGDNPLSLTPQIPHKSFADDQNDRNRVV